MEITALEDYACLFLDQIAELFCSGSVSEPTYIKVVYRYSGPVRPGQPANRSRTLVEGFYYADFNGEISLDFRDIISDLFNLNPYHSYDKDPLQIQWVYGSDEESAATKNTYVFLASSEVKERISDIDFLAIPADAVLGISFLVPENYRYSVGVVQSGRYTDIYTSETANEEDSLVYESIDVKLTPNVDDDPSMSYQSTVYDIIEGDFQQFAFSDRFGGYSFIPMSGTLERSTEYEFENARYQSGYGKIAGTGFPVFTQYTGGLTKKAAAALSGLLTSDHIYHRVGDAWHRILIEEADITFGNTDSLHFGNFSFRYAEDLSLSDTL